MADLGELKRLDPRTAWPHEAQDFTPWLAEHLAQPGAEPSWACDSSG